MPQLLQEAVEVKGQVWLRLGGRSGLCRCVVGGVSARRCGVGAHMMQRGLAWRRRAWYGGSFVIVPIVVVMLVVMFVVLVVGDG